MVCYENYNTDISVLQDFSSTGRTVDWKYKKQMTEFFAESFKRLDMEKRYMSLKYCGTDLEFLESSSNGSKALNKANFCKVRLCPMCAWRRSLKIYSQASQCMDLLQEENKYSYIFVSLTLRNCVPDELPKTLDHLFHAFKKLHKRAKVKKAFKGYFSALEVTYNSYREEFHPHFHVIYAVDKKYFKGKDYINQSELTELWRNSLDVDYIPQVDIRKVKEDSGNIKKAVCETAKYTVKSSDIVVKDDFGNINLTHTDNVIYHLDHALFNRRLVSFAGCFREAKKMLGLDDAENGDLIKTGDKIRSDVYDLIVRYKWGAGATGEKNYYKVETKLNTERTD